MYSTQYRLNHFRRDHRLRFGHRIPVTLHRCCPYRQRMLAPSLPANNYSCGNRHAAEDEEGLEICGKYCVLVACVLRTVSGSRVDQGPRVYYLTNG